MPACPGERSWPLYILSISCYTRASSNSSRTPAFSVFEVPSQSCTQHPAPNTQHGIFTTRCHDPQLRLQRIERHHPHLQPLCLQHRRVFRHRCQTAPIPAKPLQLRSRPGFTFPRRDRQQRRRFRAPQRRNPRLRIRTLLPPAARLRRYRRDPHLP